MMAVSVSGLAKATLQNFHVSAVRAGTLNVSNGEPQLAVSSSSIFRFPELVPAARLILIQNSK